MSFLLCSAARSLAVVANHDSTGSVPAGLSPVYVHRQSRPLAEVLRELLLGSNNYVANQIFLEMGAKSLGGPVSLEKSVTVARKVLAEHGLADSIQLEEGSGLSRGNRFTARGLAKVLSLFAPHMGLLKSDKGASYTARNPRVMRSPVRTPLPSSSALVPTVVP